MSEHQTPNASLFSGCSLAAAAQHQAPGTKTSQSRPKGLALTSATHLPLRHLPVAFVVIIMAIIYSIYVFVHCGWMVQSEGRERRGYVEAAVFHLLTLMVLVCFVRSMFTAPGTIPDDDEWLFQPDPPWDDSGLPWRRPGAQAQETKKTGEPRTCKWCAKYKPDRCHHCRACRTCVLKMDHHCPWICNCVGFRNHKYFFLLVLYAGVDCHFITWTMLESVRRTLATEDVQFSKMVLLLFGTTLSLLMACVLTCFLVFHVWLAVGGMTTIEFCEQKQKTGSYGSAWDNGLCQNLRGTLGPHVLLWLLPFSPPEGDGLRWYAAESTPLTSDLEAGSGKRSSGKRVQFHNVVPREAGPPRGASTPSCTQPPSGPLFRAACASPPTEANCSLVGLLSRSPSIPTESVHTVSAQ